VEPLPQLGRERDRHDQPARGQARARGGDLLLDDRAVDRLRVLARDRRGRDGRRGGGDHQEERRAGEGDREGLGRAHCRGAYVRVHIGGGARGHDGARCDSGGGARAARHHHGQILEQEMSKGLVVVGSVALDSVEANGTVHDDVLGGSPSFFSTAASYFAPVKLVAVVGEDMPEQHLSFLGSRGVDLTGLERAKGKTFRWKGRYSSDLASRTTLDTQLNVFADFKPRLPEAWRDGEFLFLGNIHPSLQ